jgi:hypothetical protein
MKAGNLRRAATLGVGTVGALAGLAKTALAQGDAAGVAGRAVKPQFGDPYGFLSTLVFGLIGIALAIIGFKLFDVVIKADVENEICSNRNVAAGILGAAVILGVSIIVAATILS